MIIAVLSRATHYTTVHGLYQWDYGQVLRIQGLDLPKAAEIHFALQETGGEAVTRIGITDDGVTDVVIPDSMLGRETDRKYNIWAFIYVRDADSGETTYKIQMPVEARPKPEAYDTPEDRELFAGAIQAANDAIARADQAEKQAEGWAHGRDDLPDRAEDNAKFYANQAAEDAKQTAEDREAVAKLVEATSGIGKDVETVRQYKANAEKAAGEAASAKNAAEEAQAKAESAQKAAEDAKGGASQAAGNADTARQAAQDAQKGAETARTAAENAALSADQSRAAAAESASQAGAYRDQAAGSATQAAQSEAAAMESRNQAGQYAASAEASAQAAQEAAEQTEKDAAQTADDRTATAADREAVAEDRRAVEQTVAEIAGDREQIGVNADAISGLIDQMARTAPGIVCQASGKTIMVTGSAEKPFESLTVYEKSEQLTTTGAQLFDGENALDGYVTTTGEIYPANAINNEKYNSYIDVSGMSNISFNMLVTVQGEEPMVWIGIGFYDANKEFIKRETLTRGSSAGREELILGTVAVPENALYMQPSARFYSDGRLMLAKGDVPIKWEPYTGGKPSPSSDYPQEIVLGPEEVNITVTGGNLFDAKTALAKQIELGIVSIGNDGSVILNGNFNTINRSFSIHLKAGTYAFAGEEQVFHKLTPNDGIWEKTVTFDTDQEISCYIFPGTYTNKIMHPMINAGSDHIPWEPYKPAQTFSVAIPDGLCAIPSPYGIEETYTDDSGKKWYSDAIEVNSDGTGKLIKRIGRFTFDGSENIGVNDDSLNNTFSVNIRNALLSNKPSVAGLCNRFMTGRGDEERFNVGYGLVYLWISRDKLNGKDTTLEDVRNFLNDKPIEVISALETPIEIPLTSEEVQAFKSLHTYKPTTVITNDAGAHMEVSYIADTRSYIDSKFAAMLDAVIGTQAAILKEV